jgi:pseudo-rSAM protein
MKKNIMILSINSYVYYKVEHNGYVFYNTLNHLKVFGTDMKIVDSLKKNIDLKNHLIIYEYSEISKSSDLLKLINELKFYDMCIDISNCKQYSKIAHTSRHPEIVFDSYLNSSCNLRRANFFQLSIYVNSCSDSKYNQFRSNEQIVFPQYYSEIRSLPQSPELMMFFETILESNLRKLNLIIGEIDSTNDYLYIINYFRNSNIVIELYTLFADFCKNHRYIDEIRLLNPKVKINIIYLCSLHGNEIANSIKTNETVFNFIVQNEMDLDIVSRCVDKTSKYNIIPYCNDNNMKFISEHLYTDMSDIVERNLFLRDITASRIMNNHFFGRFNLFLNGDIYIGMSEKIGNIIEMQFDDLLYDAHFTARNWFFSRSKISPCKNCFLCDLCPSISDYELSLEKFNLCNVKI